MIIRNDMDPCTTPLTDSQVQEFIKAGIRLFHNHRDKTWYINKHYFADQHPIMQEALRRIVVGAPSKEEEFEYAARDALAAKAESEAGSE